MLRIITKNLGAFVEGGPWHVKLAPNRFIDAHGIVGFRVSKTSSGWNVYPLCGPLAPTLNEMSKKSRNFKARQEAFTHAENEIRRWCGEMAALFGDVKEAA